MTVFVCVRRWHQPLNSEYVLDLVQPFSVFFSFFVALFLLISEKTSHCVWKKRRLKIKSARLSKIKYLHLSCSFHQITNNHSNKCNLETSRLFHTSPAVVTSVSGRNLTNVYHHSVILASVNVFLEVEKMDCIHWNWWNITAGIEKPTSLCFFLRQRYLQIWVLCLRFFLEIFYFWIISYNSWEL